MKFTKWSNEFELLRVGQEISFIMFWPTCSPKILSVIFDYEVYRENNAILE